MAVQDWQPPPDHCSASGPIFVVSGADNPLPPHVVGTGLEIGYIAKRTMIARANRCIAAAVVKSHFNIGRDVILVIVRGDTPNDLDEAADNEFEAFLKYGNLAESEVMRIRMEKESFADVDPTDFAGIIVGGGPSNVSDEEINKPAYQLRFEKELDSLYEGIFEKDIP